MYLNYYFYLNDEMPINTSAIKFHNDHLARLSKNNMTLGIPYCFFPIRSQLFQLNYNVLITHVITPRLEGMWMEGFLLHIPQKFR